MVSTMSMITQKSPNRFQCANSTCAHQLCQATREGFVVVVVRHRPGALDLAAVSVAGACGVLACKMLLGGSWLLYALLLCALVMAAHALNRFRGAVPLPIVVSDLR